MAGNRLDESKRWYLKEIVDLAVQEELPAVVCIHPEWEFRNISSVMRTFAGFLAFLEDVARFLASGWSPKQLALQ